MILLRKWKDETTFSDIGFFNTIEEIVSFIEKSFWNDTFTLIFPYYIDKEDSEKMNLAYVGEDNGFEYFYEG